MIACFPFVTEAQSIQAYSLDIVDFINDAVIPVLFGIALLAFIFNVIRYFIFGATDSSVKSNARSYALYSIGAFVILVSIWGIVNLLVVGFLGSTQTDAPCPDFPGISCDNILGADGTGPSGYLFDLFLPPDEFDAVYGSPDEIPPPVGLEPEDEPLVSGSFWCSVFGECD